MNKIDGLNFSTSELRKYRDQARAMAVKAAIEKAHDLAKAAQRQRLLVQHRLARCGGGRNHYGSRQDRSECLSGDDLQIDGWASRWAILSG